MQGRLSPQVNGKIQAFPWKHWQNEFKIASENNFKIIEWTIDQERFLENPLMTEDGKAEIKRISKKYEVKIPRRAAEISPRNLLSASRNTKRRTSRRAS